jgi:FixJ family two-component response regulator
MKKASFKIYIVDDDPAVRRSLSLLLRSCEFPVESFASAEELLAMEDYAGEGCIILDIFMDGRSGLELQEEINRKFACLPIIFLTGRGDIPMSVQALKKGAVNFLQKPVEDHILLEAVNEALHLSREISIEIRETNRIKSLFNTLTNREIQVLRHLVTGKLNKQIAGDLNIAEHTVKLHRGNITKKLGVKSIAELVKLAQKINLQ